jgi:hypothetical protein
MLLLFIKMYLALYVFKSNFFAKNVSEWLAKPPNRGWVIELLPGAAPDVWCSPLEEAQCSLM